MGKCNKRSLAKRRISRKKRSTKKLRSGGGMDFLSYFSSNPSSSQQKSSPSDQSKQLLTCKDDCLDRITELSQQVYVEKDQDMKNVLINMMKTLYAQIKDSTEKQQAKLLISQCESSL